MSKRLNTPDTEADIQLTACLDERASFVMVAGAGSGKTTSLVKGLSHVVKSLGQELRKSGQRVACITYTEVAAAEIWNDVGNSPLIQVSTIHSFFWSLISPFQKDIQQWVASKIGTDIAELQEKAANFGARVQQRTKDKNAASILKLQTLVGIISEVKAFNYGTGSDYSKGILGHEDIIKLVTCLIEAKPLFRSIIVQKYPVIFVDESQDTFQEIVTALKILAVSSRAFCVGFFGDPMQKIYPRGVGEINEEPGWRHVTKLENFRCSTEVITVINNIRRDADGLAQLPGPNNRNRQGYVRMFILPADGNRSSNLERVKEFMANNTHDPAWNTDAVKMLVIVHRMAATRLGFLQLYTALNDNSPTSFKEGLTDGTAWPLRPFLQFVLPAITGKKRNRNIDIMALLKESSPLLSKEELEGKNIAEHIKIVGRLVRRLKELFEENSHVGKILRFLDQSRLYLIDERFRPFLNQAGGNVEPDGTQEAESVQLANSMANYFECPVNEFVGYQKYLDEESPFATQQGIKGAEFERVLTICDDGEGTHTHFSYDKYFGVAELSDTDIENQAEGRDSAIERTRRLFYVSCSRAEKDLAVVYFIANPDEAIVQVRAQNLFRHDQILRIADLPPVVALI